MGFITDNDTVFRYLHILSGITWIGMLYFFNLVNLPLLKIQLKKPYDVNMAEKAAAPIIAKTLFFFRWGAAFTVLFGLILAYGHGDGYSQMWDAGVRLPVLAIAMGMAFGIIMAFNVWVVIWPRQQKILTNNKAIAASTDDAEKKRLADANAPLVKTATFASRMNTWLSIPMLWGMVFGAHGYGAAEDSLRGWLFPLVLLIVLLGLMYSYSQPPKAKKDAAAPAATPPVTPPAK